MLAAQLRQLLEAEPDGSVAALEVVDGLDQALIHGLGRIGEAQAGALAAFGSALGGSPLRDRVAEAVEKVCAGSVGEEHLSALAAGRAALLGAVHDAHLARLDSVLGRARANWVTALSEVDNTTADGATAGGAAAGGATADGAAAGGATVGGAAAGGATADGAAAGGATVGGAAAGGAAVGGATSVRGKGDGSGENLLAGCRSWLAELAITGWQGVGPDLVAASGNAVQAAYAQPGLRRLAVLLDGFAAELAACHPIAAMPQVPARRWADLWSRGMLLSHGAGMPRFAAGEVTGRLLILGVDVHEHETAVQLQVHGVLEGGGAAPRLVRASVSAGKTNSVNGSALWQLFSAYPKMLNGLSKQCTLELSGMPLLPSGDLVWREERASIGEVADPFAAARVLLAAAVAPAVPPLQRHPVRIAEPVLLEGYAVRDGARLDLGDSKFGADSKIRAGSKIGAGSKIEADSKIGGSEIELDLSRLPGCGPLTADQVAGSSALLGLLRWDAGRWLVQPLAVRATVKKKAVTVHNGQWALGPPEKVAKSAGDPVAVLRERAGRLLRK